MAINVIKLQTSNNILQGSEINLVATTNQTRNFGVEGDYVEMNVYDPLNNFLYQISPFNGYKIPGTYQANPEGTFTQELEFLPDNDSLSLGFSYGVYKIEYNILRPKIINTPNKIFFIKEISADRTEIRLSTNSVSDTALSDGTLAFIDENQSLGYFKEFYINFGQGNLQPAINIALDQNTTPSSVLIKLLNPLPLNIAINALASVSEKISNSQSYQVDISPDPVIITYPSLRGPNFDLEIDNIVAYTTTVL